MHNLDPLVKTLVTWQSGHQCIFHCIISDERREAEGEPCPDHNEQLLMQPKSKFPNAVKLMKEADPEVKKEGNENKNKKRAVSRKGTRPPKQNKGGKKGDSGGNGGCCGRTRSPSAALRAEHWMVWEHDTAFSGTGRRLHSEPSAAANAKKAKSTSLKGDVAHLAEVNKNNSKLHSLLLHQVIYDVARDGTKMDGGGTMLGRKENYLAWNVNKWGKLYENLDGKMCMATYKVGTNGVKVTETFQMLPAHFVKAMLSSMFDQGCHPHFSDVDFPSMKDLFWSMGWHFVFPEDAPQPSSLVDAFRGVGCAGMGYAGTWMGW